MDRCTHPSLGDWVGTGVPVSLARVPVYPCQGAVRVRRSPPVTVTRTDMCAGRMCQVFVSC